MEVRIDENGEVRFIYNDELVDLMEEGQAKVQRASTVEPGSDGLWEVDLRMSGGPVMGGFRLRQDALDAEVAWLKEHKIPILA